MSETTAAIACRISRDTRGDKLGVERQERECRKLAKALDLEVDDRHVYVDNDRTAYGGKPRPGYAELVLAIESGEVNCVLAWHPDRLHRDMEEHEAWIKLVRRHRVRIVTIQGGERDLTKAADRMVARVVAATSQYESELKSERQRSKALELAENGKPQGGPRPLGYESSRREKVRPREARLIREATSRLLHGASQGDVCRWLNEHGYTTAQGHSWTVSRLRKLLMRADIAGLREVRDEDGVVGTVTASWRAIISVEEHQRLRAILTNVRRHRSPSRYLLTPPDPLAFCHCGAPLYGAGERDHRTYRCKPQSDLGSATQRGCGSTHIRADWLEAHVVKVALAWATSPDVIQSRRAERERVESEAAMTRAEIAGLDADEAWLNDLALEVRMRPSEYRRKLGEINRRRDQLARALARVQSAEESVTEGGEFTEAWSRFVDLTHNEQRAVLRSLLVKVTVKPTRRPGSTVFDPLRVVIRPDWGHRPDKQAELDQLPVATVDRT